MLRLAFAAALLAAAAPVAAQSFAGTWSAKHPSGGGIILTLEQDSSGGVTGALEGNGNHFKVEARVGPEGLLGEVINQNVFIKGLLENRELHLIMFELGIDGTPNRESARAIVFARAKPGAAKPQGERKHEPAGELGQLLTRSAWCSFTYNKHSGTSTRERVVFRGDGVLLQNRGAETYSSGGGGVVAGDHRSAGQARWKVAGNTLHLSEDGATWTPQPLQVTQNSNGHPIIKSGGKEYSACD